MAKQSTKENWRRRALTAEAELYVQTFAAALAALRWAPPTSERIGGVPPWQAGRLLARVGFPPPTADTWFADLLAVTP